MHILGLPTWLSGKESACSTGVAGDNVGSLGREDALEKGMAVHPSILTWKIPWTEKPGGYSPCDHIESDTTKVTKHTHVHILKCELYNVNE